MRVLLQRVSRARVTVDDAVVGSTDAGLLLLAGLTHGDSQSTVRKMAERVLGLRIFPDQVGKMNLSVVDVSGDILVVSQFTLYGDTSRGRRPSFVDAARPEHAVPLYELFKECLAESGLRVQSGIFGAMMQVELVNNGPVTLMLEG